MDNIISFITIHVGHNFGSNLQTIATSIILKRLGYDPIVVNYIPERVTARSFWRHAFASPIAFLKGIVNVPTFYKNLSIYNSFLSKYCTLSAPIYDRDCFKSKCPTADIYLTGSDQVWNSEHNRSINTRYFFEGIHGKKISYGSSFGVESIDFDEFSTFKKLLEDYSAISVREESAKRIVQSMGYEVTQVLDPTLMLTKEEWSRFSSAKKINFPYLLMYVPYNIVNKPLLYQAGRVIAKKYNLKIVTFSWDFRKEKLADVTVNYANPGDFLTLMSNASIVLTNSFHGTAFSINLNKQFVVFMPSGYGTRISSLLTLCGLQDRLMSDLESLNVLENMIDYSNVNNILDKEREASLDYLKGALNG